MNECQRFTVVAQKRKAPAPPSPRRRITAFFAPRAEGGQPSDSTTVTPAPITQTSSHTPFLTRAPRIEISDSEDDSTLLPPARHGGGNQAEEEDAVADSSSSSDDEQAGAAPSSRSLQQLSLVTSEMARATCEKMKSGYSTRSGQSVPRMQTNSLGCWLAQKATNRSVNGYVTVAPEGLTSRLGLAKQASSTAKKSSRKALPQGIHRLAVLAYQQAEARRRLLDGEHASHLCHNPTCFRPSHIHVEPKWMNEDRKDCGKKRRIVMIVGGKRIRQTLASLGCKHNPPCLFVEEEIYGEEQQD